MGLGIEDQVCSLELSNRLKELGVEQHSIFFWYQYAWDGWIVNIKGQLPFNADPKEENMCSAFTASELIEMLPAEIGNPHLEICKCRDGGYGFEYLCGDDWHSEGNTLANGAANMLIKLLELKLL